MKTNSLVSDVLSLTMATTGILHELKKTIKIDYTIDALDDSRRELYINFINDTIEELNNYKKTFKHKEFNNFVNKVVKFLKKDLEDQLHYEKLSDDIRDILHRNVVSNKNRLEEENEFLEMKIFSKNTNCLKLKNNCK